MRRIRSTWDSELYPPFALLGCPFPLRGQGMKDLSQYCIVNPYPLFHEVKEVPSAAQAEKAEVKS